MVYIKLAKSKSWPKSYWENDIQSLLFADTLSNQAKLFLWLHNNTLLCVGVYRIKSKSSWWSCDNRSEHFQRVYVVLQIPLVAYSKAITLYLSEMTQQDVTFFSLSAVQSSDFCLCRLSGDVAWPDFCLLKKTKCNIEQADILRSKKYARKVQSVSTRVCRRKEPEEPNYRPVIIAFNLLCLPWTQMAS